MMREKVKKLWKLCFNDSEEFTELYFRLRYNNDINIAIQSGERSDCLPTNVALSYDVRRRRYSYSLYIRRLHTP